jgi:hypothetical protein
LKEISEDKWKKIDDEILMDAMKKILYRLETGMEDK